MGNLTVKITKSKNISFMRLSLFYLIFIVQIFFTSPGMYVLQYPDVAKSQTMVNERLLSELTVFTVEGEKENNLKTVTLQCLSELEKVEVAYRDFKKSTGVIGDRLRESKFAETQIRNGSWGKIIEGVLKNYIEAYKRASNGTRRVVRPPSRSLRVVETCALATVHTARGRAGGRRDHAFYVTKRSWDLGPHAPETHSTCMPVARSDEATQRERLAVSEVCTLRRLRDDRA